MSLRAQLYLYLMLLQVIPLGVAIHAIAHGQLLYFFLMELLVLSSVVIGLWLIRAASRPIEFIQTSKVAIENRAFNSRLKPLGIRELDEVRGLFNTMLEELHKEQLKLGEQRGFFDKLLQATPIGIVIFDFDDRISNVNPAAEQMLELEYRALQAGALAGHASPLANAILEHEQKLPALITLPDGRRFRVQQSAFYDRGFQRKFLMMEELTQEMQAAERNTYEQLIRMTSHEVNNTIGATNSLLQGCKEYVTQLQPQDGENFARALEVVMVRNSRLGEFMLRLAQVVHLPAPDCQPVDLRLLIQNIQAMFAVELKSRNITWHLHCGDLPEVNLDTHLFEQVLINIIKNAYEAIDRDGSITVSLKQGAELIIEDSAGVLTQADKLKLLKPFYSTKRNGQGIGLMLVREILNQHGFRYSLDCEPGQWTRFRIVF